MTGRRLCGVHGDPHHSPHVRRLRHRRHTAPLVPALGLLRVFYHLWIFPPGGVTNVYRCPITSDGDDGLGSSCRCDWEHRRAACGLPSPPAASTTRSFRHRSSTRTSSATHRGLSRAPSGGGSPAAQPSPVPTLPCAAPAAPTSGWGQVTTLYFFRRASRRPSVTWSPSASSTRRPFPWTLWKRHAPAFWATLSGLLPSTTTVRQEI